MTDVYVYTGPAGCCLCPAPARWVTVTDGTARNTYCTTHSNKGGRTPDPLNQ